MYSFIEGLTDHQREGFDFQNTQKDESVTETQNGIQRKVVRKIWNRYILKLQDLNLSEIKEFIRKLVELEDNNQRIAIPIDLFDSYLGDATGTLECNFNSSDLQTNEKEERFSITLVCTEVVIP